MRFDLPKSDGRPHKLADVLRSEASAAITAGGRTSITAHLAYKLEHSSCVSQFGARFVPRAESPNRWCPPHGLSAQLAACVVRRVSLPKLISDDEDPLITIYS